jgi:hypothetical protein
MRVGINVRAHRLVELASLVAASAASPAARA